MVKCIAFRQMFVRSSHTNCVLVALMKKKPVEATDSIQSEPMDVWAGKVKDILQNILRQMNLT